MLNWLLGLALAAMAAYAVYRAWGKAKKGGGCCGEHETVALRPVKDKNKAHYPYALALTIGGMTCENCARRVANALNGLDGVWAQARLDGGRATVRCKNPPDEGALRAAVSGAGYAVLSCEKISSGD